MSETPEDRLAALGIDLPDAPAPAANYVPWVRSGDLVFVSGQVPMAGGELETGRLGEHLTTADGAAAARLCAIALIAQLSKACDGDLNRVKRVVKLTGWVNCTPEFGDQPQVINGASDLMVAVFGEAGAHARAAVGAPSLPFGVPVEVEGIFEVG